uniref:hypothetical protein n=1 Tax=uncultured Bilophila sp. TaxID=529385 RepID=UPI0025EC1DEE|nr:hypothetical protein [uncultured Bilophila sp.]
MAKDFSQLYKIIYDYFLRHPDSSTLGTSRRAFAKWLEISTGKAQAWEDKGQWPSAEDLEILHKKMGFSYRWLVTGEGDPFSELESVHQISSVPQTVPSAGIRMDELEREKMELTQKLLALHEELASSQKQVIALQQENKRLAESVSAVVTPTETRRGNPQHATSDRPASGVPGGGI